MSRRRALKLQTLRPILRFASTWHDGPWSIDTLPRDLAVGMAVLPADRDLLGAAVIGPRGASVMVAAWAAETALVRPIIAHECAHILHGISGLCRREAPDRDAERLAAYGSALLAVPLDAAERLMPIEPADRHTLEDLGVPWQLLAMRASLAILLQERAGSQADARIVLETSHRSLNQWIRRTPPVVDAAFLAAHCSLHLAHQSGVTLS